MSVRNTIARLLGRLWRGRRGAAAVEFAFVAPLLIAFTAGIFEVIFIAYDYNLASEATRRGLRVAVLQPPVGTITGIDTTPVVCTSAGGASCTGGALSSGATFNAVVAAIQAIKPNVAAANVQVTYSTSGLDDPITGPGIITSLITVRLIGLSYNFQLLAVVPGMPTRFDFPAFTASAIGPSQSS